MTSSPINTRNLNKSHMETMAHIMKKKIGMDSRSFIVRE